MEVEAGNPASKALAIIRGRGLPQGTYVVKELVYAYAMWISAAFQLKVIRAFDTLQTQGVAVADHAAEDLLKNPSNQGLRYAVAPGEAQRTPHCVP